jgi:hypothetical protein
MVLLPPAIIAILCAGFGFLSSSERMFDKISGGFCDPEDSAYSAMITGILMNNERFKEFLTIEKYDRETLLSKMNAGELDAAIFLPDNFVADMQVGINHPIEVMCNESEPLKAAVIREFMQSAAAQITAAQSTINTIWFHSDTDSLDQSARNNLFNSLVMNYVLMAFTRDKYFSQATVSAFGDYGIEHFFIASSLSLFIFLMCATCIKPVIRNSGRDIYKRLYASGRGPFSIALLGQLPIFIISFAQSLAILAILKLLSSFGPTAGLIDLSGITPVSAALVAAATAAICLLASSIVHLACLLFRSVEATEIFSFAFIIFSAVIGGTVIPYAYLPGIFEKIGFFSFSRWAQSAVLSAAFERWSGGAADVTAVTATGAAHIGSEAAAVGATTVGSIGDSAVAGIGQWLHGSTAVVLIAAFAGISLLLLCASAALIKRDISGARIT